MRDQAIALCRISSIGQSLGHSLEAQEQSVGNMAGEMNLDLVKTWSITQSSKAGNNLKRHDLAEIRTTCKQNRKIKYLLVDRVSRLMREWKMMLIYIFELESMGVKVIFCDSSQRHLNSDDQMSQLLLIIEGFKTEQENKERAETTISKMKSRYAAGYYLSHPHPGYMKSNVPGIHSPDKSRFELLQKGSRLIIFAQYTPKQAVRWINENGYRTSGGKKLDLGKYSKAIVDRYYCGIISIKSEGWVKNADGLHEPMFSKREHELLVRILSKRNPQIRRRHNPDFPVANLIRHEECKHEDLSNKYSGFWKNKGTRSNGQQRPLSPVYRCRACRRQVSRERLHNGIDDHLSNLEFLPSNTAFKKALLKVWRNQRGTINQRLNVLQASKGKLEEDIKTTAVKYADEPEGAVKNALRLVLEDFDNRLKEIQNNISSAKNVEIESEDFVQFAFDYVTKLQKQWWSMSFDDRRRGEQILFNGDFFVDNYAKVHTPNISSIYRLGTNKKALSDMDNAHLVELVGTAPTSASLTR